MTWQVVDGVGARVVEWQSEVVGTFGGVPELVIYAGITDVVDPEATAVQWDLVWEESAAGDPPYVSPLPNGRVAVHFISTRYGGAMGAATITATINSSPVPGELKAWATEVLSWGELTIGPQTAIAGGTTAAGGDHDILSPPACYVNISKSGDIFANPQGAFEHQQWFLDAYYWKPLNPSHAPVHVRLNMEFGTSNAENSLVDGVWTLIDGTKVFGLVSTGEGYQTLQATLSFSTDGGATVYATSGLYEISLTTFPPP